MESILMSIKKLLGLRTTTAASIPTLSSTALNSAFSTLTQLGVGPKDGFFLPGQNRHLVWKFIGDRKDSEFVKMCVYLKVRLVFDPPQSGTHVDAITKRVRA